MFGQVADVEAEESGSESEDEAGAPPSDSDSDVHEAPEEAERVHPRRAPERSDAAAPAPSTDAIRDMLPAFMEQLLPRLEARGTKGAPW